MKEQEDKQRFEPPSGMFTGLSIVQNTCDQFI